MQGSGNSAGKAEELQPEHAVKAYWNLKRNDYPRDPTRDLKGVIFFKSLLFWPSGKTEREEHGSQLPETDHSTHPLFNNSAPGQVKSIRDYIPLGVSFQGQILDSM